MNIRQSELLFGYRVSPLLLAGLVAACGTATPVIGTASCGVSMPQEGSLTSRRNLRLGAPVLFDDGVGISSGRCFPLFDGSRLVTWLHAYHQAEHRLFVQRCEEAAVGEGVSGSRSGAIAETYVELTFDQGRTDFGELPTPSWSEFSNPSFCGTRMAYWGVRFDGNEPLTVQAIVFDLATGRVVKQAVLGQILPESDSRDFFVRPRWSVDGASVSFCGRPGGAGAPPLPDHRVDLVEHATAPSVSESMISECR